MHLDPMHLEPMHLDPMHLDMYARLAPSVNMHGSMLYPDWLNERQVHLYPAVWIPELKHFRRGESGLMPSTFGSH